MNKHSTQQTSELAALRHQKDEDIDLSDIPELSDTSRAVIGEFYRPIKKPVTIRLDADVLGWLKGQGSGYQTRINTILRRAMDREAR